MHDRDELLHLLRDYIDVFARDDFDLGLAQLFSHHIDMKDNAPVRQRLYRTPHTANEIIDGQVKNMIDRNIIQPSNSPWNSNVVVVKKKDGSHRFCVDFRKFNLLTEKMSTRYREFQKF